MIRKLFLEERDESKEDRNSRVDSFGEGLKEGANSGFNVFVVFLIFFIISMIYLIRTF